MSIIITELDELLAALPKPLYIADVKGYDI